MSLKYKKLKKYFPAEILYSHFHNTKSVFLDSSLKNKYGKYSVIALYPYLEVKESNNARGQDPRGHDAAGAGGL